MSVSKAVVFGGAVVEYYDYGKQAITLKSTLYCQAGMRDFGSSCGFDISHVQCMPSVVEACQQSEPVLSSYEHGYRPFTIVTKSRVSQGAKTKPTFTEEALLDAFPSPNHLDFPIIPELDLTPLYRSTDFDLPTNEIPGDVVQRLLVGILVGSKRFVLEGKTYIVCNFLVPFDTGVKSFGYSVTYASAKEDVYNWHMKHRGAPLVVLFNGYSEIGKGHSEKFVAIYVKPISEIYEALGLPVPEQYVIRKEHILSKPVSSPSVINGTTPASVPTPASVSTPASVPASPVDDGLDADGLDADGLAPWMRGDDSSEGVK